MKLCVLYVMRIMFLGSGCCSCLVSISFVLIAVGSGLDRIVLALAAGKRCVMRKKKGMMIQMGGIHKICFLGDMHRDHLWQLFGELDKFKVVVRRNYGHQWTTYHALQRSILRGTQSRRVMDSQMTYKPKIWRNIVDLVKISDHKALVQASQLQRYLAEAAPLAKQCC